MNPTQFKVIAVVIILILGYYLPIFSTCASAYMESTEYLDETYLHDYQELVHTNKIVAYLRSSGVVKDSVDRDELDYIITMVNQLTSQYENVTPGLILAMIAYESRFDTNAKSSSGARGLMQLLPCYHEDRLIQFIDEDTKYTRDLFYDERLNIATGIDYMNYILSETNGDVLYALMWYNQGAISASTDYEEHGYVSYYAKGISTLADGLDTLIRLSKKWGVKFDTPAS